MEILDADLYSHPGHDALTGVEFAITYNASNDYFCGKLPKCLPKSYLSLDYPYFQYNYSRAPHTCNNYQNALFFT